MCAKIQKEKMDDKKLTTKSQNCFVNNEREIELLCVLYMFLKLTCIRS